MVKPYNKQAIINGLDDIIEDDISIESCYDNIYISVKEDPDEGVDENEKYSIPTINGDDDEQEME